MSPSPRPSAELRLGTTLSLMLAAVACGPGWGADGPAAPTVRGASTGVIELEVAAGGPNPAPLSVELSSSGPCVLELEAVARTTDDLDWLTATPGAGTLDAGAPVALTVALDVEGPALGPGTYTGTIEVAARCAVTGQPARGSPVAIGVNLWVTPSVDIYTVGGLVTGLGGADLALQNNGAELLNIKGDGPFAFPVPDGGSYAITVAQQPPVPSLSCSVENGSGVVLGSDVTDVVVACVVAVEPLYGGPDLWWNDYVLNDGATWFDASGTSCDGSEPGPWAVCLHAAEMMSVAVPGALDCAGLEATDALDAFEWTCLDDGAAVRMVSIALRGEARLADLIDASGAEPGWRPNSVTVTDEGAPVAGTNPTVWYGNPLVVPELTNVPTVLDTPGTIAVVPADGAGSLAVAAPRVGVVVMPGAVLERLGSVSGIVVAQPGADFLWIEGELRAGSALPAVRLEGTRRSVVRQVTAQLATVRLLGATSNRLADVRVHGGNNSVLLDASSAWNQLERVAVFGFTVSGVTVNGSNNVLADVVAAHGRFPLDIRQSEGPASSNVLLDATSAVALSTGLRVTGAPDTTVMNLAALDLTIGLDADVDLRAHNVAAADSFQNDAPTYGTGVRVYSGTSPLFTGLFVLGNNRFNCQLAFEITPHACSHSQFDGFFDQVTFVPADPDVPEPPNQLSLVGAFVAQAYPADPPPADASNAHGDDGLEGHSAITDFVHFDNRYRGWGRDGVFPSAAVKSDCRSVPTEQTCGIYDWSAAADDVILRGLLPLPVGADAEVAVHRWTVADETECAAIPGASWVAGVCQSELLLNAVELSRDGVGNDNLLCEPGERCLATRNLGAYQGHGPLVAVPQPGGLAGDIALFEYSSNGR